MRLRRFILIATLVNLVGYGVYGRPSFRQLWEPIPSSPSNPPAPPIIPPDPNIPDLAERLNVEKILKAFAEVESGNRNLPPRWDVRQRSWGYYQFGRARWIEVGGKPGRWGIADKEEQDCVMLMALLKYLKNIPPGTDVLTWMGRHHNTGHGEMTDSLYTLKLKSGYRSLP